MLNIARLDIDEAHALIAGARAKAKEGDLCVCIAITDESGNLMAFERMDGSKMTSIQLAIDKAFTAVGIKKSTQALGDVNQPGMPAHGISSALGGRMVAVAGGLPVHSNGEVVGGIGVSGGSPAQDQDIAQAAIDAASAFHS